MRSEPLVSVVVLTYNSGRYIEKTLNSVLSQDYQRIELIVSDDASNDNTCEIVEKWLNINSKRFEKSCIIKSFKNRGTCANYNQGCYNSHGYFIKTLDGDDLFSTCTAVSDYVNYLLNSEFEICISDLDLVTAGQYDLSEYEQTYKRYFACACESLLEQKKRIVYELCIPDPGVFFTRNLYDIVGGFDEKYRLQEEWPFFTKVLNADFKIGALNKKLVNYQLLPTSATHGKEKKSTVKKLCIKDNLDFFIDYRLKRMLKEKQYKLLIIQFYIYVRDYIKQII